VVFLSGEMSVKKSVRTKNHENLVNTGYWEGSPPQGLYGVLHSARMKHEKNPQVLQATAG
jgi:hypothetical protein